MSRPEKDYRNILVVSTCGISLLLNHADAAERSFLNKMTGAPESEFDTGGREILSRVMEKARQAVFSAADRSALTSLSAEINSINSLHEYFGVFQGQGLKKVDHCLICTDSWIARSAAGIVEQWLNRCGVAGCNVKAFRLPVDDIETFHQGIDDLVEYMAQLLPAETLAARRVVFNLTGGYKSLQGYMQTLGNLWAEETVYLYEGSGTLLHIPRIPVNFDFGDQIATNLQAFRKVEAGLKLTSAERARVPDGLLVDMGDDCLLSFYGKMAWKSSKNSLLNKCLLDPLSPKLRFCGRFRDQIDDLSPERICQINEKLDRFCFFLEEGQNGASLLARDQFKKIKGEKGGMTHELYAWSDADARRIFGRYAGEVFEMHELGAHL